MRLKFAVLSIVALAVTGVSVRAQGEGIDWGAEDPGTFTSNVQVAGSRAALQLLDKAKADLLAGEFERGLRGIQTVLDHHSLGAVGEEGKVARSARQICHELLGAQPESTRELYRKIFDGYARAGYEAALSRRDPDGLRDVFSRYLFTSYGKPSLTAAATLEMERGNIHDAQALALLAVESFPDDVASIAGAAALAGLARALEGRGAEILALKARLPEAALETAVMVGGAPEILGDYLDRIAVGAPVLGDDVLAPDPNTFRQATWTRLVEMPERMPRTQSTFNDIDGFATEDRFAWHPATPVLDDSALYVSTGTSVHAFNLFSGEDKWKKPAWGFANQAQARRNLSVTYPLVLDRGILYAALELPVEEERTIWSFTPHYAVPRRRLFAFDAATGAEIWTHAEWRGRTPAEGEFVAHLDVNSDPLVVGDDLFVGATRYHTSYHHYLVCFDRRSGELKWSTFVCTGQMEQNMFGNRVRECIPGKVVERDGIVYYATNVGVVAAVDARQGTLRFATPYRQVEIPRQTRFDPTVQERAPGWVQSRPIVYGDTLFVAPMDSNDLLAVDIRSGAARTIVTRTGRNRLRWLIGVHDDTLIVGGRQIIFFDAGTLKKKTEIPLTKTAGPRDGIQGAPMIAESKLYATVRSSGADQMWVWDLAKLKLEVAVDLPRQQGSVFAGNIVGRGSAHAVASTVLQNSRPSVIILRGYIDKVAFRARLEAAVAKDPNDPEARLRLGELFMQERDWEAGAKNLLLAVEAAKARGDAARLVLTKAESALFRLYTGIVQAPEAERRKLGLDVFSSLEAALRYAATPLQETNIRFRLLREAAAIKDWARFGSYAAAIRERHGDDPYEYDDIFVQDVSDLPTLRRYPRSGLVALVVEAAYATSGDRFEVAVDRWQEVIRLYPRDMLGRSTAGNLAAERIGVLIEQQGRGVYAKHESAAEALFTGAADAVDIASLQKVISLYPNALKVTDSYLRLARSLATEGRAAEAVSAIHECLARGRSGPGEEYALLADLFAKAGCAESAADAWRVIAEESSRSPAADPKEQALADRARAALGPAGPRDRRSAFKEKKLGLKLALAWQNGKEGQAEEWRLLEPEGRRPSAADEIVLAARGEQWFAFAAADGKELWKRTSGTQPMRDGALVYGDGRLVAIENGELLALEPASGREHWREPLGLDRPRALAIGQGKVYLLLVTDNDTFMVQGRSLLDGRVLSQTSFEGAPLEKIDVGRRWVMVTLQNEARAVLFDGFTGRTPRVFGAGVAFDPTFLPFLNADDRVVVATRAGRGRGLEIRASDIETGRETWSRELGDATIKDVVADKDTVLFVLNTREGQPIPRPRDSMLLLDAVRGTALVSRMLPADTQLRPGACFTGGDLYGILRRTSREPGMTIRIAVECVDIATQAPLWQTSPFTNGQDVAVLPFDGGLVLVVTERRFKNGRTMTSTNLYTVDKRSAKFVWEAPLATAAGGAERNVRIIGGRLAVADGPVLKVYAP